MLPESVTADSQCPPLAPAATAGKPGAPKANTNRTLHGLRGSGLPKGCARLYRRINDFRRSLCQAVEGSAGSIDLHAAATIDSACQWQRHALLAARWLRIQHDELTADQRLAFSREVAKASTERDRCIRLLGLDAKPDASPWAMLDRLQEREALEAAIGDEKPTLPAVASNLAPPDDSYARPTPEACFADNAPGEAVGGQEGNRIDLPVLPFEAQL